MLFYYLCTVGEKLHKEAYPQGAQSKDADVYKWVALQSDKQGFDLAKRKPDVGETFDSRWGPSLVVERSDDPTTGTYLLLRIFPHGYAGKPGELGLDRHDTPKELVGKV